MQAPPHDVERRRRVVAEFEASGESARAFAEPRGLTASALGYWRRRLSKSSVVTAPKSLAISFVEVRPAAAAGRYEIVLGNGRVVVVVGSQFDDLTLDRLLRVVEGGA